MLPVCSFEFVGRRLGPVVEYWDFPFGEGAGVELEGGLTGGVLRAARGRRLHVVAQVVLDGQQGGGDQQVVGLGVGGAFSVAGRDPDFDVSLPVGRVVEGHAAVDFGVEGDPVGPQGVVLVLAAWLPHLEVTLVGQGLDVGHDGLGLG